MTEFMHIIALIWKGNLYQFLSTYMYTLSGYFGTACGAKPLNVCHIVCMFSEVPLCIVMIAVLKKQIIKFILFNLDNMKPRRLTKLTSSKLTILK